MIVRVFRAKVRSGKQEEFQRFVLEHAAPDVKRQKGVLAMYSGKPIGSNSDEFVFVSLWRSLDDLKAYAGEEWEKSVVEPEEIPLISDTFIHNYEVYYKEAEKTDGQS